MDLFLNAVVALLSVIVGWALATLTQFGVSRQQEKDARLASAYSIFHKVQTYAGATARLCAFIKSKRERANELQRDLWTVLRPLYLAQDDRAQFTPSELALFSAAGEQAYADRLMNLASLHNVLTAYWSLYIDLVETLDELAEPLASTAPEPSEVDIGEDFDRAYPVKLAKVRSLAGALVTLAEKGSTEADSIALSVGPMLSKHLRDKRFAVALTKSGVAPTISEKAGPGG